MANYTGRGALGGAVNRPQIDEGTLNRNRSTPPGPVGTSCSDDMYVYGLTSTMRAGLWAVQDKFAHQIFDLWLKGQTMEVTFGDEEWAQYMRADEGLKRQIHDALVLHAEMMRRDVDQSNGTLGQSFHHRFHVEIGGPAGGYLSGYKLLHGTNKDAGDFEISGTFTAIRPGPPGSAYTVTYDDLEFVFNDIIDINKRYPVDRGLGRFTTGMAKCLYNRPPKDYTLHIKWKAEGSVKVEVAVATDAQTRQSR